MVTESFLPEVDRIGKPCTQHLTSDVLNMLKCTTEFEKQGNIIAWIFTLETKNQSLNLLMYDKPLFTLYLLPNSYLGGIS